MAEGLAASMVYGNGSGSTVTHYYDKKSTTKGNTMACKTTKKPGKK